REDIGVLRLARVRPARDPFGREPGLVLLIEVRSVNAVRERLQCERPIAQPRDEVRRDLCVVADEVRLRVAVLGKKHLLEIRQLYAPALDLEDRRDARSLLAARGRRARRRGALRGLLRFLRGFAPLFTGDLTRIDI